MQKCRKCSPLPTTMRTPDMPRTDSLQAARPALSTEDPGPAGPATALLALTALPLVAAATDSEQLDEEFLEYLAEFDGKDDWTWFNADDDDQPPPKKPPASPKT